MRVMRLLPIAMVATIAMVEKLPVASATCSYCRYTAWNCSVEETIMNEMNVQGEKSELRKENAPPLSVCDTNGKIQIDDVFCTDSNCDCVEGKRCVSMMLGCQNIFQARNRKRCIGDSAIQERFQNCAHKHTLTTQPKVNLDVDWVYFNDLNLCRSDDCHVVQKFRDSGAVQCGRLVVAWKENATEYRFVVDGSRADMKAGTFLFSISTNSITTHSTIPSKVIPDCYSLQTRNQKDGNCDGVYLQADTNLLASSDSQKLSELDWLAYIAVVGSVGAAIAAVASVIFVVMRHRREREQEECNGLLPDDSTELKTPPLEPSNVIDTSNPGSRSLRQRPLSPPTENPQ